MRFITPLLFMSIALLSNLSAEGTREVAPNGNIDIGGNSTTDLAALHINHPAYNNFASFSNNDPHSRLYIHIKDPSKECIFLGLSFGHLNANGPNPTPINYQYRIKDPAGNIVFGPVAVTAATAKIQTWAQGNTGPMEIYGAGGYDAEEISAADLSSQGWTGSGDYYIEFLSAGGADLLIDFWDFSVADCSESTPVEKKGRVWSYNWSFFAINDFGFPNRPFNGAFYVCAPDPDEPQKAFITKIDFNGSGFRPAAFNIAFNSFGSMNTGNIEEDRKSRENENSTQSEYAIFLNDPIELCETAVAGEILLHGISRCDADGYCIKFTTSKDGQVELLLDFDGPDDLYTPGTRDVLIAHNVTPEEVGVPTCIPWDGLDGFGQPMPEIAGTMIPITISFAQGIYHFPIYDAEFMTAGFSLQAIRPSASVPLLYYDDSNITVVSGSGEPQIQLSGCNVPCHRWTNFPDANIPGFGNLNTINSWWFSQRVVRQDVLLLPAYYTCQIDGPEKICQGGTTQILSNPQVHPGGIAGPAIISATWNGPGIIGPNTGNAITIDAAGSYNVEIVWITQLGDTCSAACEYVLLIEPPLEETIDTLIVQGQVLNINGELYTEAGQYIQQLTNTAGCDSILTINVIVLQTILYYDLDACLSFIENGSHMDYSEFTAVQPQPLSCADISATILFREPASMQKHSCTPGVNNSVAMCISSLDACTYDPGNDASLVFEVTITPDPDTAVHLTGFSFFEQAPLNYNWINGASGLNNYPTLYGLRILKNGVEIYRREDIPTTSSWTEVSYDFLNEDDFIIEDPATFRFELLPYCLIGNGSDVAAWDIDEIQVTASCAPFEGLTQIISGTIKTPAGEPLKDVEIRLTESSNSYENGPSFTDAEGYYQFTDVLEGVSCQLNAFKNTDHKNGVSTLDLVILQRHLLGIKTFDSPYQYIAADANKNDALSAKDLLELRKLILGIYEVLPNNTSWRFGTADENNGGYPWGFKEPLNIEVLQYDYPNADFTAVKIGDLNGDVAVRSTGPKILPRNADIFHLQFEDQFMTAGSVVTVEVRAGESSILSGLQFAMELNGLQFQEIKSGGCTISDENFRITENEIIFSWGNSLPIEVDAGEKLFSISFIAKNTGRLSGMMVLSDKSLTAEAYVNEELDVVKIAFEPLDAEHQPVKNLLYQNEPNPFSDKTTIRFQIEKPGVVTVTILDLSGKILNRVTGYRDEGLHTIDFSGAAIGNIHGVLICQLQSEGFTETIKMVRM